MSSEIFFNLASVRHSARRLRSIASLPRMCLRLFGSAVVRSGFMPVIGAFGSAGACAVATPDDERAAEPETVAARRRSRCVHVDSDPRQAAVVAQTDVAVPPWVSIDAVCWC